MRNRFAYVQQREKNVLSSSYNKHMRLLSNLSTELAFNI